MTAIERLDQNDRLSHVVSYGDTVYLSGQVAEKPFAPVAEQTRQILAKIDNRLIEAGTDKSRILSATVWLADITSYDEMNAAWDAWVSKGNAPARSTIGSQLAKPGIFVEIAVVAAC